MGYLLTLAFILRLIFLNQSLWLDESIQALALMGKMGPLMQYALADYQPPLYHLIGYVSTHIFGYSEIALRLPSLFAGVLTVYFVVKIGQLLSTEQVAYTAGILAATNPLLTYYSQEGRTYALTTFFVTASFYYFIKLINDKNSPKLSSIFYLLATCSFIWTSYLSWFVILSQTIYALWKKRYDIVGLQVLAAFTLFAWLPSFLSSLAIGRSTLTTSPEWGRVVGGLDWRSLPLTWVKFNIGRIGFDNKQLYLGIVATIFILHVFLLRRLSLRKNYLLFLWIIPPVILGLVTASIIPVYSYFRVLFVLPAYLLLLAIGSAKHSRLLVIINLIFLMIFWFSPKSHKEDWRKLVAELPPNATLAMPSRAQIAPLRYYGYSKEVLEPSHEELVGNQIYYIRYVEDLFDTTKLGQANFAKSGYTITSQKVYSGIQLDIYENSH